MDVHKKSISIAAKQEKVQPLKSCFFLTSPFIELTRQMDGIPQSRPRLATLSNEALEPA